MTQSSSSSKDVLRREARARRGALALAQPDFARTLVRLAGNIALPAESAVASYWPLKDEADPRALAAALAARGHPILLPGIVARGERLVFRRWREGEELHVGEFGVHAPLASAAMAGPAAVLVPLLGFDRDGHRLGYGGGYYDRTLRALRDKRNVLAIGIAYAGQELDAIPHGRHDEKLDMIVTENGLRHF